MGKCGISGARLNGCVPNRGNFKNKRLTLRQQKRQPVTRTYGGNLSGAVVRLRIIRAFLSEECRIASKYRKIQKRQRALRAKAKLAEAGNKKNRNRRGATKSSKGKEKKTKEKKRKEKKRKEKKRKEKKRKE